jgi:hypothetical protein
MPQAAKVVHLECSLEMQTQANPKLNLIERAGLLKQMHGGTSGHAQDIISHRYRD